MNPFTYLRLALSETDGTPSSKRVLFFMAVAAALLFCAFDLVKHGAITPEMKGLCLQVVYITGTAYGVTKIFEPGDPKPPVGPPTAPAV
jgi:hypothetical protein